MGNTGPKTGFNLLQILGDLVFVNLAILLAFLIRFQGHLSLHNFTPYLKIFPEISVVALLLFNFYGIYYTKNKIWAEILASLIASISILTVFTVALSYMFQTNSFPRSVFFIAAVIQVVVLGIWRWLMLNWERKLTLPDRVIVIAPETEAEVLADKLTAGGEKVLGLVVSAAEKQAQIQVLGTYEEVKEICRLHQPTAIYMSGAVPEIVRDRVARAALRDGWQVFVIPSSYEIMVSQARTDQLQDTPVFEIGLQSNNRGGELVKRMMDVAIALTGLILASPIMVVTSLAIKLTSPGPIFYSQERVSKMGKRFMLYKFRTMVNDAEKASGPVLAVEKDSRITPVGRFLRATRVDEIPQLFNVLKGDMSIVGPRPERPFFVEQFEKEIPGYKYRHLMKAGVTGLAQVAGRYSTSAEDKLRYDLIYVKGASLFFDLQIMLQTVKVLLMRDKAS